MLINLERAKAWMRQCKLDALVAASPTNVRYFSDYTCWLDPLFKEYMVKPGGASHPAQAQLVLLPLEGEPALIVSPLFAVNAADLWIRDVRVYGDAGLDESLTPSELPLATQELYARLHQGRDSANGISALAKVLQARGLSSGRIGIEKEALTLLQEAELMDALPDASIKDATNLIRLIRAVKSADEIALLERAAEISEQAGMASFALARPGVEWAELARNYWAQVTDAGATVDHFSYAPNGLGIATEPKYVLGAEDVMYVDWGCIYQGYFSDTGTTLALRELTPDLQERFRWVRESMDAGIAALRPGVKASEVQHSMGQAISANHAVVSYPHGHSFGLDVRDYPILAPDSGLHLRDDCIDIPADLPLESNMVINLEAPIFMPGVGSVHLEQSFVITADGSRPLIKQDRSQPFIPA